MGKFIVAVCGNIGVGKSTLAKLLSKRWGYSIISEPQDINPFLKDFYADQKRWALHSQLFFLIHRLKIFEEIEKSDDSFIIDRTIYEDAEIFAKQLLNKEEYKLYQEVYNLIYKNFPSPNLLIYLYAPTELLLKRIEERGRYYEKNIKKSYLKKLNDAYENWISSYNLSPVYKLDTTQFDIHNLFSDLSHFIDEIEKFFWEAKKDVKR
ncbi:MAG TPA: deoxynucleoside kinase [Caldisericia bacterium]|nr:deoxynucleoside kinase [Caldisericia bacterium]HOL83374.1 deoxynucleoside kinase [Caldisericia bacterium]HON83905.1 deoxynucleoside kinase [Caldisericia bacterium]HPC56631.1 deoxynucleoside kinase [Caldisericia bacterium]HPP43953.1 deoxynucleoside kinase [Caldisericia bacterium]